MKAIATNIKVSFAGEVVILSDADDRQTTNKGVTIWMKRRGPELQPMAEIPYGTLNQYMHDRPSVLSVEWK
jgi:hypothetical protein